METDTLSRKLADNSFDIINILNADATIRYESRATQRILGYEAGARVGRSALEFVHPEDQRYIQEQFQQLVATPGGRAFVEFRFRHEDGSWVWLETNGQNFLHDPDLQGILINSRDVTARKQAELKLQESETRLKMAEQIGKIGHWEYNFITNTIAWAEQTYRLYERDPRLGFPTLEEEAVYYTPEDRVRLQALAAQVIATGAPVENVEFTVNLPSGRFAVYSSAMYLLTDGKGVAQSVFGTVQDITERKQAEEKLRVAEETYRHIFLNAQVGMLRTDIQTGLVLDANDALAHFTGYRDREEMLAASLRIVERYVHPGDREKILALLRANGEFTDFEAPFRRNDGTIILTRFSARLVPDKGWIEGVAVDITKERQAEASLRENAALLARSQEIGHLGSWQLDLTADHLTWSDEVYRIFGCAPQAFAATYEVFLDFTHPDDRATVDDAYSGSLRAGDSSYEIEHRIVRKDTGEIRHVREQCVHERDVAGAIVRSTGIIQDITERKQAEAMIQVRLRLMQFAATHTLVELLQQMLDEVEALTGSLVGFYHFVDADQQALTLQAWSTRTVREFCRAEGHTMHYAVANAGVWADCVRQRRAIIHNDYAALPDRRGLPAGHAPVIRELVVPIFREERVVAILGVGNKPGDYTEQDVKIVTYIADVVWETIERKHAEVQLQDYQRRLEAQNLELRKLLQAIEQSGSIIVITDAKGMIQYANPYFEQATGYTREEAFGQNPRILKSNEHSTAYYRELWQTISGGRVWRGEFHNRRKDGTLYWEAATIAPVLDANGKITHYIATKEDVTARKEAEAALLRYAGRLEMLHKMGDAILAAQSPEDIAQVAIRYLQEAIPGAHVWVAELDNATGAMHFLTGQLADGNPLASFIKELPVSTRCFEPAELVFGRAHAYVYLDCVQLPEDSIAYALMTHCNARSCYLISLQAHNQSIGLLNLALVDADVLTTEDEQVVQEMANSLAIVLYQARLYAQIQEDARIKAALLREVNHRVSNNLMAIIGLMYAEGRYAPPESHAVVEATLERLIQRVEGLAEVHRMLSQSQWAPVCLNVLTTQIIQMGRRSLPAGQTIAADISPVPVVVSPRQAGYLALIITELVTNTIKYALCGRAAVCIAVSIREEEETIHFAYRDDGPGYPEAVLRLEKYDVGLHLVQQLTRSLDGILTLNSDEGAITTIVFGNEAKDRT